MKGYLLIVLASILLSQAAATTRAGFDYGFALEFDGAKDFVDLPPLAFLGGAMTFEAWVYPEGGAGPIFEYGNGYRSDAIRLRWSGGACTFEMWYSNTNAHVLVSAPVPAFTWSMVTVVLRDDNTASIYVNGANPRNAVKWYLPRLLTRTANYFGRDTAGNYFTGVIDELVVWGLALDASQITTRKTITGNETAILYYWNLDQGIGAIAEDLGRSKSHGALGGGVLYNYPYWVVPKAVFSATCSSCGDPHITTFDGTYWNFQGSGEYWLLKSGDGQISLQTRQDQWIGNPGACVNIGLALRAYQDTVSIDVDFRRHPGKIFLRTNGQLRNPSETSIYLPNSGIIINFVPLPNQGYVYWEIDVPFLYAIKMVSYYSQYSNYWLRVYEDRYNTPLGGECGDWNGNRNDDFRNPNTGRVYNQNDPYTFGQSLKVSASESYFNENNVYVDVVPVLQYQFLDPVLEAQANSICKNRQLVSSDLEFGCLYDIAITGDIRLGFAAAQATYEACLQTAATKTGAPQCTKPCPSFCSFQGTCNADGTCTCKPGFTARDCSVQKQYWCTKATYDLKATFPKVVNFNAVESKSNIVDYYAYNTRYPSSSNTGFEISNATVMFLEHYKPSVDSTVSQTSFLFINDRFEDGSGGTMFAKFALTDTSGNPMPLQIQVQDDPGDTYNWDATHGTGTADWRWWECCTDGLALGFLPETTPWNLRVDIDFTQVSGIDQLFIGSRAPTGGLDIFKVDMDKATAGIIFSGGWCYDPCGDHGNCSSCLDQVECGWCDDVGVCTSGTASGPVRSRCESWRWSKDTSISRQITFDIGYPVDPSAISFFLAKDDPIDAHIYVNMPAYEVMPVDILILQDLSYSNFNPYLHFLQSIYRTVYQSTVGIYPLARFGLASFTDKPILPYGSPTAGDYVYQLRVTMTSNSQKFQAGIDAMKIADGQDTPMAQLEALLQIALRVNEAGFADTAKKIVIVVTKSPFHTPTGAFPPNNGDDNIDANEDYPTVAAVRTALLNANVVPVFVVPGEVASVYRDLINGWGFGYVSVMSWGVENLGNQIMEGINFVCTSPYLTPNQQGFIQSISPQIYRGISPGIRVNFDVTLLDDGNSTTSTIVSPGYGPVSLSAVRDDLPKPDPTTNYTLLEDSVVVAQLTGTSAYGDELQAVVAVIPTRATLYQYVGGAQGDAIIANGTVLTDALKRVWFVPPLNANGLPYDTLTYKLKDTCEGCSVNTVVTFYVIPVNDPPIASAVSPVSTNEDTPLLLTLGGTDPDGPNLTSIVILPQDGLGDLYQYVAGNGSNVGDKLTPNNTVLTDSQFRAWYIPRPNLNGNTTFSYYLSDSLSTSNVVNIFVIVIPVNDPPVAISSSVITKEDTPVGVIFSGTDVDVGDVLTASIPTLPTLGQLYQWSSDNVTLGPLINIAGSAITDRLGRAWYVPNYHLHSTNGSVFEVVTFTLTDRGVPPPSLSSTGTLSVTVIHVNHPPEALPGNNTGAEDSIQVLTLTGFDPDTAVDGDVLYGFLCSLPSGGTIYQYDGTQIDSSSRNANGTYTVTDSKNRLRYLPNKDQNCHTCANPYDSFMFMMADRLFGDPARLLSSCQPFYLYVTPVNDPPVASAQSPFDGVEDNDTVVMLRCADVDIEPNSIRITVAGTKGTLYQASQLNPSTWVRDPSNTVLTAGTLVTAVVWDGNLYHYGYVVFRGAPLGNGWPYDSFSFDCEDANTTSNVVAVEINLQAINYPPIANDIANITILEDTTADIRINGTDVDSPHVYPQVVGAPTNDSQIGWLYQVNNDGSLGAKILINNNQPTPVTNINNLVRFVPAKDQNDQTIGSPFVTIFYGVNDGNASSVPKAVSIFVTPVNDPPVAEDKLYGGDEDTDIAFFLRGTDIDNGQDQLTTYIDTLVTRGQLYQVDSLGNRGQPITAPGPVTDSFGRIIYHAPLNEHSPDGITPYVTFTYHVEDQEPLKSQTATVSIVVFSVDDPPVAISQDPVIGNEDSYVVVTLNATDVDDVSSSLQYSVSGTPKGTVYQYDSTTTPPLGAKIPSGTVATVANLATVVFVPDPVTYSSLNTSVLISYATLFFTVSDPSGLTSAGQAVLYIVHVDPPPVAITDRFDVLEDWPPTLESLLGTDVDDVDKTLLSRVVVGPSKGRMFQATSNTLLQIGDLFNVTFRYEPFPITHGVDSLIYQVFDGILFSANKTVTINIQHVNHQPEAAMLGHVSGFQNGDIGPFELHGTDVDGDTPLVATVRSLPTRGTVFQVNADLSKGAAITTVPTTVTNANRYVIYRQSVDNTYGVTYDYFSYTINDSQNAPNSESAPAYAIIDLQLLNHPPTAFARTPAVGWEDLALMIPLQGTTGDEGLLNQTITAFISTFPAVGVLHQTTTNATVGPDGALNDFSVLYIPPLHVHSVNDSSQNYRPLTRFGFKTMDSLGAISTEFFVDIIIQMIDYMPTPIYNSTLVTLEDTPITFTLDSSDIENDPRYFKVRFVPQSSLGTFTVGGTVLSMTSQFPSPSIVTFTPAKDRNGDPFTTFRFTVTDQPFPTSLEVEYTIQVSVIAVNDPPSIRLNSRDEIILPDPDSNGFTEIWYNTSMTSDGFVGVVPLNFTASDVDADQNDLTFTAKTSKNSITQIYIPFAGPNGLIEVRGFSVTFTGTLDQINAGLNNMQLERFDSNLGDELFTITLNDHGATGLGGPMVYNKTYLLRERFIDQTSGGGSPGVITGAAVGGGVGAIAAVFGAYKMLKKKNLIDSADPWESEDAFQSTVDNPLYNYDQNNANVLYEPPPSGTA